MMLQINVNQTFLDRWPELAIGSIVADVKVNDSCDEQRAELLHLSKQIEKSMVVEQIAQSPVIQSCRKAYKACGKEPSRYRVSSEALMRRIVKGKGIYFVNNIVDINNLVSLKSHYPICLYDLDTIQEPVTFTIAEAGATFEGIGRGELNVEFLPVFKDAIGYFGSPTSDSERTKITMNTKKIFMNILSFGKEHQLKKYLDETCTLLEKYAGATITSKHIF